MRETLATLMKNEWNLDRIRDLEEYGLDTDEQNKSIVFNLS